MAKKEMIRACEHCGEECPQDEAQSTVSWKVYTQETHCPCGGKYKIQII